MQKKLTLILILILVLAQLCACGKPLGHEKSNQAKGGQNPAPPPSAAEITSRLEKLKQRGMTTPAKANQLPGLGPQSKPLPPGRTPNPEAKLPEGVIPKSEVN